MGSRLAMNRDPIVDYRTVGPTFHAIRAAAAAGGLLAAALLAAVWGIPGSMEAGGLVLLPLAHALYRRRRPDDTPLWAMGIDTGVMVSLVLFTGLPALGAWPLFVYLVAVGLIFLPLARALLVSGIMAVLTVLVFAVDPAIHPARLPAPQADLAGLVLGLVAIGSMVALFVVTSEEVEAFRAHQRAALETERKAGQMKNEFVSMVSHELRTPLTSIAGFAETLRESWDTLDPQEVEEFLTIITEQSGHLSELVEDILVIPRLEAGRLRLSPAPFELRPLVYRVADLLFPPGGNREASVNIQGSVTVWADESRVRQVLRNLLENARKYGGDQVLIEGAPGGDDYLVTVSDNGPGIPDEDRERIFDPFEQLSKGDARRETGIGLGLPIARRLVRAMGGDLWYEPRFPTGARFCFTLRLHALEEEAEPAPEEVPYGSSQSS